MLHIERSKLDEGSLLERTRLHGVESHTADTPTCRVCIGFASHEATSDNPTVEAEVLFIAVLPVTLYHGKLFGPLSAP